MTTILTVLRSGGDFKPEHVQRLAKQVPGAVLGPVTIRYQGLVTG